jgi:hypothetical protein
MPLGDVCAFCEECNQCALQADMEWGTRTLHDVTQYNKVGAGDVDLGIFTLLICLDKQ